MCGSPDIAAVDGVRPLPHELNRIERALLLWLEREPAAVDRNALLGAYPDLSDLLEPMLAGAGVAGDAVRMQSTSDPDWSVRVRDSFARQPFMAMLGATIARLEPGVCELVVPFRHDLGQQHGFFHAGVVGTLADDACGYAAYSRMAATSSILTVEYKLNLLAPAQGRRLRALATVLRSGRTLTVCRADVFVGDDGDERLCAAAQATLIQLADTPDRPR